MIALRTGELATMTSFAGSWVTLGRFGVAGLLCGAFALGCSGESDGEGDDGGGSASPVAAEDFAERFAVAYCGSIAGCCEQFGESFVQADCEQSTRSAIAGVVADELASPYVEFDEVAAGSCIAAYGAALRACTDREVGRAIGPACDGVFRGTVEVGGECGDTSECAQPGASEGNVSCEEGVCTLYADYVDLADAPHGTEGEACGGTCERTGPSSYGCAGGGMSGDKACWVNEGFVCGADSTCQPVPKLGEPCPEYYCAGGSYCDVNTTVCAAPQDTGPCSDHDACTATSYCDFETSQCAPLKADGEACESDEECQGGGCPGGSCRVWSVASAETCAGLVGD